MTAISAQSASQTPSTANARRDLVASLRTVVVPASPATYANRVVLREMGFRWDPRGHQWHGTASAENVRALREQLGLEVRCFGALDSQSEIAPKPASPRPTPVPVTSPPRDGSRTHFESRLAFPGENDSDEFVTPSRRFTLAEITSGLPDDSREEDERAEARRLRELRARVKAARAIVSTAPGLTEVLQEDWKRTAHFYARFGITEEVFRFGVPVEDDSARPSPDASAQPVAQCVSAVAAIPV